MATIVTKTIGTTGRDYSTIAAWMAACPANLVTADQVWKGVAYNDSTFNEQVDITGITTDATRYVWLTVADGQDHQGTLTGGVVINRGGADGTVVNINCNYTVFEGFRITNSFFNSTNTIINGNSRTGLRIRRIVIHSCAISNVTQSQTYIAIDVTSCASTIVSNCLVANLTGKTYGSNWIGIRVQSTTSTYVYNCTVYKVFLGITVYLCSAVACLVSTPETDYIGNAGACYYSSSAGSSAYNVSTDATAIGTNPKINQSDASLLTNSAGGDFTLKAGSPASHYGPDAVTNTGSTEIRNRAGRYNDVGAFGTIIKSYSVGTRATYSTGTVSSSTDGYTLTFAGGASIDGTNYWGEGDLVILQNNSAAYSSAFSTDFNAKIYAYVLTANSTTQITLQTPVPPGITGTTYSLQRAYSSLITWAATCPPDLVIPDIVYKVIGYNDSVFVGGPVFSNIVCDASRHIWCTVSSLVNQRHNGRQYTTSACRCEPTAIYTGATEFGFSFSNTPYALVEWWQVNAVNGPRSSLMSAYYTAFEHPTFRNNIIYLPNFYLQLFNGAIDSTGSSARVYNNLIYGKCNRGINATYGTYAFNNTVCLTHTASNFIQYGTYYQAKGIDAATGNNFIKNNIVFIGDPSGVCYITNVGTSGSHNMSGDGTAIGASSIYYQSAAKQFPSVPVLLKKIYEASDDIVATTRVVSGFIPCANKLYLLTLAAHTSYSAPTEPVVTTANGLNFVLVQSGYYNNKHPVYLWRAMKPSGLASGTITVTWPDFIDYARISLIEYDNVDTSGIDGAGAVVQSAVNSAYVGPNSGDIGVTLSGFASTYNRTFLAFSAYSSNMSGLVPKTGFNSIGGQPTGAGMNMIITEKTTPDTAPSGLVYCTAADSAAATAIGAEIKTNDLYAYYGTESFELRQAEDARVSGVTSTAIGSGDILSGFFTSDIRNIYSRGTSWDMGARQHSTIITKSIGASGRNYSSISAWNSASPTNLIVSGVIWKGECYKDADLVSGGVQLGLSVKSDADSYNWLSVAPGNRHTFQFQTGAKMNRNNSTGICLRQSNAYNVVEWLEIMNHAGQGDQAGAFSFCGVYCIARNLLIYNTTTRQGAGSHCHDGNGAFYGKVYNNVIYNMNIGLHNYSVSNSTVNSYYNNTIYNCGSGFELQVGNYYAEYRNNISVGNFANFANIGTAASGNSGYNIYESGNPTIMPGSSCIVSTPAGTFRDIATLDFRLKTGASAIGAGQNQSVIFNYDNIGGDRVSPWTIGAFIYYTYSTIKGRLPMTFFFGRGPLE